MNIIFEDKDLKELITTGKNRRYKKFTKDYRFMDSLYRVYNTMSATTAAPELAQYSFLHYEQLKGNGKSSVRVMNGRVERIIFREIDNGIEITILELDESHYGKKK